MSYVSGDILAKQQLVVENVPVAAQRPPTCRSAGTRPQKIDGRFHVTPIQDVNCPELSLRDDPPAPPVICAKLHLRNINVTLHVIIFVFFSID